MHSTKVPVNLSSYQRKCVQEHVAEGAEIIEYGRLDGDWATLVMRKNGIEQRIAFPRTKAVEREFSAYA